MLRVSEFNASNTHDPNADAGVKGWRHGLLDKNHRALGPCTQRDVGNESSISQCRIRYINTADKSQYWLTREDAPNARSHDIPRALDAATRDSCEVGHLL